MKNIPRFMIAAPKSGSGKTLITCGLLSALKKRGMDVFSLKSGPDYIDPLFHRTALNIPSFNLDTYFTNRQDTRALFADAAGSHEIGVFEGVMGLFDGVGGVELTGSSYDLADTCGCPIILVVDTKGSARSIIPVIKGFKDYDTKGLIKGVILNNMSGMLYKTLGPLVEEESGLRLLGYFEKHEDLKLESRHLGLVLPGEREDMDRVLATAGEYVEASINVDGILEIAAGAEPIEEPGFMERFGSDPEMEVTIGVARDEAFCFYYEHNLRLLEKLGAKIEYFSPLRDEALPKGLDGILLGGGYPELYEKELIANTSMIKSLKDALSSGIVSLAECGGFMYLHMIGVIEGDLEYKGRPVRFGYAYFKEKEGHFLPEETAIKGHEFHYYDSTANGSDAVAAKPSSKRSWECCHIGENHWWGFGHLYYPSCPEFAQRFVEKCKVCN